MTKKNYKLDITFVVGMLVCILIYALVPNKQVINAHMTKIEVMYIALERDFKSDYEGDRWTMYEKLSWPNSNIVKKHEVRFKGGSVDFSTEEVIRKSNIK